VAKQCIGGAIFLRHGQSEYTEVFPDLTEQGKQTIKDSARQIKGVVDQYDHYEIWSSPSARALGSASILTKSLGCNNGISVEPAIAALAIRDAKRARTFFDKFGFGKNLSLAYNFQPCFEDESIFEPRSEIRKRFYKYLGALAAKLAESPVKSCLVHVSHYEVLYHFVETFFKLDYNVDQPLAHGEPIILSFYGSDGKPTEIQAFFREQTVSGSFLNI
jgi:broad specificity phosphatase PhoE